MTSGPAIRPGTHDDLPALVEIYNHYVARTHVTFDTEPVTVESRRAWFGTFSKRGPWRLLVADRGAGPVGYATSGRFRPKPGYDTSVETTVYLDPHCTGQGIGTTLYGSLLQELEAVDSLHRAWGGIALPNPESIALHERLGFRHAGTFREVGRKFGRLYDVAWYGRSLRT